MVAIPIGLVTIVVTQFDPKLLMNVYTDIQILIQDLKVLQILITPELFLMQKLPPPPSMPPFSPLLIFELCILKVKDRGLGEERESIKQLQTLVGPFIGAHTYSMPIILQV